MRLFRQRFLLTSRAGICAASALTINPRLANTRSRVTGILAGPQDERDGVLLAPGDALALPAVLHYPANARCRPPLPALWPEGKHVATAMGKVASDAPVGSGAVYTAENELSPMRTEGDARRATLYAALGFCQLAAAPDMPELAAFKAWMSTWRDRRHRRRHGAAGLRGLAAQARRPAERTRRRHARPCSVPPGKR
jgi:hypothetical protein